MAKTVENLWKSYEAEVVPRDAGPVQRQESRRAFYGGTKALFDELLRRSAEPATSNDAEWLPRVDGSIQIWKQKPMAVTPHFSKEIRLPRCVLRVTTDKDERRSQKGLLKEAYADYDPRRHDAFVIRWNEEAERERQEAYQKARGLDG